MVKGHISPLKKTNETSLKSYTFYASVQEYANVLGCSLETKLRSDLKLAKPLLRNITGCLHLEKLK